MHRPEWDGARLTGGLTDAGLFATRNRLLAELAWLVDTPPRLVAAQRFANHLATESTALLTFSLGPGGGCDQLARRTGHPPRGRNP